MNTDTGINWSLLLFQFTSWIRQWCIFSSWLNLTQAILHVFVHLLRKTSLSSPQPQLGSFHFFHKLHLIFSAHFTLSNSEFEVI